MIVACGNFLVRPFFYLKMALFDVIEQFLLLYDGVIVKNIWECFLTLNLLENPNKLLIFTQRMLYGN